MISRVQGGTEHLNPHGGFSIFPGACGTLPSMGQKQRQEIREEMLAVLHRLDARWSRVASQSLTSHLEQLLRSREYGAVRHILGFLPLFAGQPDLIPFLRAQSLTHQIYLPQVVSAGKMEFVRIESGILRLGDLDALRRHLPDGEPFDTVAADGAVVLVPGVAFDLSGNRLGFGHLRYARVLGACMAEAKKIGVGWKMQLLDRLPVASEDAMVDGFVHERGVVTTKVDFDDLISPGLE